VTALAESFGRGAMTNHWIDLKNSDVILVMGSNAASNHPISFKWVQRAVDKGAVLLSVDPRFTQTSSKAHIYAPLRSGSDIAFLGGMIRYILEKQLYFEQYVREYTNASYIVNPAFKLAADNGGVFSGLTETPTGGKYDKTTWTFVTGADGLPAKDPSMKNPGCVLALLKREYDRYDIKTVSKVTGTPEDKLTAVYEAYAKTGVPDKAGTILYAMGFTQHTVGVQNIRAMSIIQMLLGNMGVAGGGVNALRGESNVQGSTDHGLLFHIFPGYLASPTASTPSLSAYNAARVAAVKTSDPLSASWWTNYPKYMVSLIRSFYGMNATPDEGYTYLPKIDDGANYSWLQIWDAAYKGKLKGVFAWGQNPACSGAHANKVRKGLGKLEWLVNVNLFDNETGSFWRGPGMVPAEIKTEVFMLPCAASVEKEGSITNSGRWMQWRYKAVNPPGEARPDGDIINELFLRVRELMEKENAVLKEAFTKLTWEYGPKDFVGKLKGFDAHYVAKEINGYFLQDKVVNDKQYKKGDLVPSFAMLQDDGSTSSGNWIYTQSYNADGNNSARRDGKDASGIGLFAKWAWSWPVNRRIIYNRAAVDPKGQPWAKMKPVIRWAGGKWVGDVPDGGFPPLMNADGSRNPEGKLPFIMKKDGVASVFGPGLADGPFPVHYEPLECPVPENLLNPKQLISPVIRRYDKPDVGSDVDVFAGTCDPKYPILATTYRVTEHWQTGLMTRWQPWLAEMQPSNFVEMSEELAEMKGIDNGDRVKVSSARGEIIAVAIVTKRFKPFVVGDGLELHEVGLPWHFGWRTTEEWKSNDPSVSNPEVYTFGDSANLLTATIGDPNTTIPESKAFLVNVEKVKGGWL
jgi:formate dehydrogenase major subunit